MSLREKLKQNVPETNYELTFEQYMNDVEHKDTELLALESKVSDIFNLGIINKIKNIFPFGKKQRLKTATLATLELIKGDVDESVLPIIKSYKEQKDVLKAIEKSNQWKMLKDSYHLDCGSIESMLDKSEKYFLSFQKLYKDIKTLVETTLTDTCDNKSLTAKQLAIVEMIQDVADASEFILETLTVLMDVSINEKREVYISTERLIDKIYKASTEFKNKILKGDFEKTFKYVSEIKDVALFDAINNGANIKDVANDKNGFIGNPIYHFRKWLVDLALAKAEKLRKYKSFLECVLIEKQSQLAEDPTNTQLIKQAEYYADEIEKIEAKIVKLEKI